MIFPVKKLSEFVKIQNGFAFDSKNFSEIEGVPLIRIRDLRNGVSTEIRYAGKYDDSYLVHKGDFLIGMDGEFVCYEWKGEPALLNQRVCRLYDFENLEPKFLFYGINSFLKEIQDRTAFTTVKHISSKQISNIEFPLPPLPEQKRIVKILDEVFEGIEKAKENTEKNLRNSKELFESYLQNVFANPGKTWKESSLGALYVIERGGSPRPIQKFLTEREDGINWIKIGDVAVGSKYILGTKQKIKPEGVKRSRMVHAGDFLLTNSMSFGRPYILKIDGCIHDGWLVLRSRDKSIDDNYLYFFLSSGYVFHQFDQLAAGSTVRNLNTELVKRVKIHYPESKKEQLTIVTKLESLSDKINGKKNQ
jgi:type I restriction enzyme S subunit